MKRTMIWSPICLFFLIPLHIVLPSLIIHYFKRNLKISLLFNMSVIYWFSPNTDKISKQFTVFPVCNVMYNNVFNSFSILSVGYQCVLPIKSVENSTKLNKPLLSSSRSTKVNSTLFDGCFYRKNLEELSHIGRCWVPLEQIEKVQHSYSNSRA